jgi:GcrA cell cycle regulator
VTIHTNITGQTQHVWDDETKQRMAALWNNGKSAAQVAALFGISRNVVIGLAHRNKIFKVKGRGSPSGPRQTRVPRIAKPKKPHGHTGRKVKVTREARMEAVKREAAEFMSGTSRFLQMHVDDEARLADGKDLLSLGRHECRWALNQRSPFLFCAESTGGLSVYCSHHSQRAYRPREL